MQEGDRLSLFGCFAARTEWRDFVGTDLSRVWEIFEHQRTIAFRVGEVLNGEEFNLLVHLLISVSLYLLKYGRERLSAPPCGLCGSHLLHLRAVFAGAGLWCSSGAG